MFMTQWIKNNYLFLTGCQKTFVKIEMFQVLEILLIVWKLAECSNVTDNRYFLIATESAVLMLIVYLFFILQVAGKREPEQEAEARHWIETVIGEHFPPVAFEEALRNGIILCKLMNRLAPGIITKINTSGGDYKMMDNLSQLVLNLIRVSMSYLLFFANNIFKIGFRTNKKCIIVRTLHSSTDRM